MYAEAIRILEDALVFGIKPSLDGIRLLTRGLKDPQLTYPSIQITGTNGKTSTSRFIAAILHAHGYRTGLFTSPELMYYEERIEVDQQIIDRTDFAELILTVHGCAEDLVKRGDIEVITEFELLTAAALLHFAHREVDYAVLEVGMGGRWDATSVVDPIIAVITSVDLDHTAILGSTIEEIAWEKAAIIKPGSVAVLGSGTREVASIFKQRVNDIGSTLCDLPVSLPSTILEHFPGYQAENIACAVAASEAALGHSIDESLLSSVLFTTPLPGRFETLRENPLLIIDAAHNPSAAQKLAETLKGRFGQKVPGVLLLGILADKDAIGIIDALCPLFDSVAITRSASARALPVKELADRVGSKFAGTMLCYDSIEQALNELTAVQMPVIATGSATVAGEVRCLVMQG